VYKRNIAVAKTAFRDNMALVRTCLISPIITAATQEQPATFQKVQQIQIGAAITQTEPNSVIHIIAVPIEVEPELSSIIELPILPEVSIQNLVDNPQPTHCVLNFPKVDLLPAMQDAVLPSEANLSVNMEVEAIKSGDLASTEDVQGLETKPERIAALLHSLSGSIPLDVANQIDSTLQNAFSTLLAFTKDIPEVTTKGLQVAKVSEVDVFIPQEAVPVAEVVSKQLVESAVKQNQTSPRLVLIRLALKMVENMWARASQIDDDDEPANDLFQGSIQFLVSALPHLGVITQDLSQLKVSRAPYDQWLSEVTLRIASLENAPDDSAFIDCLAMLELCTTFNCLILRHVTRRSDVLCRGDDMLSLQMAIAALEEELISKTADSDPITPGRSASVDSEEDDDFADDDEGPIDNGPFRVLTVAFLDGFEQLLCAPEQDSLLAKVVHNSPQALQEVLWEVLCEQRAMVQNFGEILLETANIYFKHTLPQGDFKPLAVPRITAGRVSDFSAQFDQFDILLDQAQRNIIYLTKKERAKLETELVMYLGNGAFDLALGPLTGFKIKMDHLFSDYDESLRQDALCTARTIIERAGPNTWGGLFGWSSTLAKTFASLCDAFSMTRHIVFDQQEPYETMDEARKYINISAYKFSDCSSGSVPEQFSSRPADD
jgi:hypothetical protein